MIKYFYTISFFLFTFTLSIIHAQNKVDLHFGYGHYLNNSENSMKLMSEEKFRFYNFYGFTYQRNDLWGYNLILDYDYNKIIKNNIIEFVRTGPDSPDPLFFFSGDITLINHNIDLDIVKKYDQYFSYGFGPSFVITNRILDIPDHLYDKLASSGLGLNGFIELSVPLDKDEQFFFTSKLKVRYTYSIWFDKGIRDLDDYYQEFLTAEIFAGVGYAF